ncbi:MAG: CidA/LrgA family protein [Oscillospiraceae bacterium]|nr:CidA/LrgA family protein [Oscillospiraceae bacterium]
MNKSLHITLELAIILAICFLGDVLVALLPFNFSASVLSMIILLILLVAKAIKFDYIKNSSSFFTSNMAVLFIPYGVKLLQYLDVIKENLMLFLLIVLLTTPIVYGVTAFTAQLVMKLQKEDE